MKKLIAFGGQAINGKDTLADYIYDKLGLCEWERNAFAKGVKEIYMDGFGVDNKFIDTWKRRDENPPGFDMSCRKALQFIGDGFRQIKANIWIDKLLAKIEGEGGIIISDERYVNEAKAIKDKGGINILIYRPGYENADPNPSEAQMGAYVKEFLDKGYNHGPVDEAFFDYFFINDSSDLESLYKKCDETLLPFIKDYI